ncbi:hypothetical protein L2725_03700 [Shewanella corallii]|uniref:Uncharacterized protein n=1 Tax=Shewanella corallii TaxID=560080 RepID=A0ABT0N364_9GAMM|nr:hypothetical protein [Shewanella corallii]MCL2912889.1 hypothetical protein [Shewanella corallii]
MESLNMIAGVKLTPGLDTERLLTLLQSAEDIVMHAALYSNFASGAVDELLRDRLLGGDLKHLTLIKLEAQSQWRDEFARILRPGLYSEQVDQLFRQSRQWCSELKLLSPTTVDLHTCQALPLQPVMLIGDTLLAGQYAHSRHTSAEGLWLELDTVALGLKPGTLQLWFKSGIAPEELDASPWLIAVSRYLEECRQAAHDIWMLTPDREQAS